MQKNSEEKEILQKETMELKLKYEKLLEEYKIE